MRHFFCLLCSFAFLSFLTQCTTAIERHYYIAAVNINWDYTGGGNERLAPSYKKTVYREYDSDFKKAKTHPSRSGLLGPTIHGQEGETIVVTFKNLADHPCSIHPHGIAYGKQSEGSSYFDNTFQFEKEDDIIFPGGGHTYYWEVTPEVAPKPADPPCVTYTYFSHNDIVRDYNTGLIGPLLICKKDSLDESGKQVHFHQELVVLFAVFDEYKTWYSKQEPSLLQNLKYTINGFTNGSLPDLSVCAHSKVTWHMLAMSSESELFSIHFNGQVLQQGGHKVSSVGLISSTATSAEMVAIYPGRWLLSSHVSKHLEAGMHGFLDVNMCEEFTAPKRKITIAQKRESQEWTYYIAAEEMTWDYAPDMPDNVDGDFRSTYIKQGAVRIGKKYKKAVYIQYKDALFKERLEQKQRKKELGILGPVIRAQIRDVIKIVFKNKASRPYSIYPHGLRIDKEAEGANYPEGGNQSHAVQPGETYTYIWRVIEEDEPSDSDSRCLTRMYHSAVNTPRDIASGLIGPLLICKSQSLNTRNVQLRADKEQHAIFAVFDENKSWYLSENINMYCGDPKKVKTDDQEFYDSNVMHTINGYVYESGQELGFCNGEIATWHVSSAGELDDIQTVTFYGHTFELNSREEDILQLFPMTGETISMNMANIGVWLLASLNTHETRKGLRLKFKDVECYRDYFDDSKKDDEDIQESFTVWKPKDESEVMKEKAKPTEKTSDMIIDEFTDEYAELLGLRSLKKNENSKDYEELLDLSLLDSNGGILYESSNSSSTMSSQNTTSLGLGSTVNNRTSTDLQNDSTTDHLLQMNPESDPPNSTVDNVNDSFRNSSVQLRQQDIDSNKDDEDLPETFTVWKPKDESELMKEKAKPTEKNTDVIIDEFTDDYAELLGLRSLKKNENSKDYEELLNLTLLDSNSGIPYESSNSSSTMSSQNMTSLGLGSIVNNLTSTDLQNDSTTDHLLQKNPESDPPNSTVDDVNDSSIQLLQQDIDLNTTSRKTYQTSEKREENTGQLHTPKSSLLTVVEVEEDEGDGKSSENHFIYSVPALTNPSNLTEVQVVEEFVLLHDAEKTETTNHGNFVKYNISQTQLSINADDKLTGTTAQTVTLDEIQEFNHTDVTSEFLNEVDKTMNASRVDFSLELNKENRSHVDTPMTIEEYKELKNSLDLKVTDVDFDELNSTQTVSVFVLDEFKEINPSLNKTDNISDLTQDFQELNKTHTDTQILEEQLKEGNHSRVDSNVTISEDFQELNRSQTVDIFPLEDQKETNSSHMGKEMILDEHNKLNNSLMDTEMAPVGFEVSNATQDESEFLEEEFKVMNSSNVNFGLINDKEFNSTHNGSQPTMDLTELKNPGGTTFLEEYLKELNYSQVNPERFKELNGTFSLENLKDMFTRINRTNGNLKATLAWIRKINGNDSWPALFQELESSKMDSENSTLNDANGTVTTNPSMNNDTAFVHSLSENTHNETKKTQWNSTKEFGSEVVFNQSTPIKNSSQAEIQVQSKSSEEGDSAVEVYEESQEEVIIYLQNSNHSKVLLSSPLHPQEKNWTYDGKHEFETVELPSNLHKYVKDNTAEEPKQSSKHKKKKIVLQRVVPRKGFGMKTKKRKEYKPQARSMISSQDFSPRGFGPSHFELRTNKHVSTDDDIQKNSIVIGIARSDFNDYELHVSNQGQNFDFDNIPDNTEEYEYVEYRDPYKKFADPHNNALDDASKYTLHMAGDKARVYFITAEEVNWDYAGYGHRREEKTSRKEKHTVFKKVVFREYLDSSFTTPHTRGELDEHLGIMGPVLKAEVDETIYIVFRNRASHPYSLHANGVSYTKNMEGLKYEDESPYYYEYDNEVQPNQTYTYIWTVNSKVGPLKDESDCRIWTYYSGVNPERDINSGLIGPLLVCRKGTLNNKPMESRDFMLLFMTFDENKSWYYEINRENIRKTDKRAVTAPDFTNNLKFPAINGIIYSLKGLRMYADQLVNWHLINMGAPKDFQSVHFHGQTFLTKHKEHHRQGVYPLLPGGFATLEMWPSKPGLWLLDSEVGISQQRGMQTLFLVLDKVCNHPLGLMSGTVKDSQITASDSRGSWQPSLARLNNAGKYNAWSTAMSGQWIQVDFQRPVVISKIATQGAKQMLTSHYLVNYTISYSTDRKKWIFYKAESKAARKTFEGNNDAYEVKENVFFPPIIGRFIRLHPSHSYNHPTVRMEFYGCELDGCSVPLGMQSGLIEDHKITASSVANSWYSGSWHPWFARLNKQGATNAWQAKNNDIYPWLQVELKDVKKITGIVTQGAKTLGKEMFVTAYVLEYSDNGKKWTQYSDDENYEQKTFVGNSDNNGQVKNYIYPPIFSKFIRIIPTLWQSAITMRIELLGCDFE